MILSTLNDSGEWYTPHFIIDLAKEVCGKFDLDVASSVEANKYIQAKNIYTIEDNGLELKWFGKVWCNNPYSKLATPLWAKKWRDECFVMPDVQEAFHLVNSNLGYDWYNKTFYSPLVMTCLLKERMYFLPADGQKAEKSRRASTLFYYGENRDQFRKVFKPWGKIIE